MKISPMPVGPSVFARFASDTFTEFSNLVVHELEQKDLPLCETTYTATINGPTQERLQLPVSIQSSIHHGYLIVRSKILLPDANKLHTYEELVMNAHPHNQGRNIDAQGVADRLNVIGKATQDSVTDQLEQFFSLENGIAQCDYELVREYLIKNSPVPVITDLECLPLDFEEKQKMDLLDLITYLGSGKHGNKLIFGKSKPSERNFRVFLGSRLATVFEYQTAL